MAGLVILAGLLPSIAWWLQVEGPYRHFLLPSFFLVLAASLTICSLAASSLKKSLGFALTALLVNQGMADAILPSILARYPWSYQPIHGERRWSTRTPLGNWFSNHAAATRGVRSEAREAAWLTWSAPDSTLVITPAPFRAEFEFLARFPTTYRYLRLDSPAPAVERIALASPTRVIYFLAGDPAPVAAVLEASRKAGDYRGQPVFIPAAGIPDGIEYPIVGMRRADRSGN